MDVRVNVFDPVMLFTCQMFQSIFQYPSSQLLTSIARKVKSSIKIGKVLQSAFLQYLENPRQVQGLSGV